MTGLTQPENHNLHLDNSLPITPLPLRRQSSSPDDEGKKPARRRDESLDGGWGWVVLFGSFYITTFINNITICFGILFSQKMNTLSASSTDVSIIYSMHSALWNLGIFMTTSLVNQFGHRSVAFWGCFVTSVSFMLLAFSSSVAFVFVIYGIVVSISGGIGSTVCFLLLPEYFDRRRGLAMAVVMTGVSFGGIISPLLIRSLQNEYGFFGGVLIHGAIISNCCVAGALYRPSPIKHKSSERNSLVEYDEVFPKKEKRSTNSTIQVLTKIKMQTSKWIARQVIVIKQLRVLMTSFSVATIMVGYINFLMLVPFAVESTGHSPMFSAWCVATFSATNTSARLLMALVADRSWFNRRVFFIFGAFLTSLCTFAFVFVSFSERLMTLVMLSAGFGVGLHMSLFHVNLIDVLGMELYADALGINSIIRGITYATTGPIFGLLHDLSGSYSLSICACAVLELCSALLLLPLPLAVTRDKKMLLKHQEDALKERNKECSGDKLVLGS